MPSPALSWPPWAVCLSSAPSPQDHSGCAAMTHCQRLLSTKDQKTSPWLEPQASYQAFRPYCPVLHGRHCQSGPDLGAAGVFPALVAYLWVVSHLLLQLASGARLSFSYQPWSLCSYPIKSCL